MAEQSWWESTWEEVKLTVGGWIGDERAVLYNEMKENHEGFESAVATVQENQALQDVMGIGEETSELEQLQMLRAQAEQDPEFFNNLNIVLENEGFQNFITDAGKDEEMVAAVRENLASPEGGGEALSNLAAALKDNPDAFEELKESGYYEAFKEEFKADPSGTMTAVREIAQSQQVITDILGEERAEALLDTLQNSEALKRLMQGGDSSLASINQQLDQIEAIIVTHPDAETALVQIVGKLDDLSPEMLDIVAANSAAGSFSFDDLAADPEAALDQVNQILDTAEKYGDLAQAEGFKEILEFQQENPGLMEKLGSIMGADASNPADMIDKLEAMVTQDEEILAKLQQVMNSNGFESFVSEIEENDDLAALIAGNDTDMKQAAALVNGLHARIAENENYLGEAAQFLDTYEGRISSLAAGANENGSISVGAEGMLSMLDQGMEMGETFASLDQVIAMIAGVVGSLLGQEYADGFMDFANNIKESVEGYLTASNEPEETVKPDEQKPQLAQNTPDPDAAPAPGQT